MSFRRFSKTLCALSLAALYTVTTFGAAIADVKSSHWAYAAITDLQSKGIMALNSSGQFFPNQVMNYFEVADVLAKATGYVDADLATSSQAQLVSDIKANYEKQKPTLQKYASKYSTWNSAYNQQIAYLLGRGYMTTDDLDKFITKSGSTETKNIVTKENLSIYLVRVLGKAKTAADSYKTTGFKDENTISIEARPYMTYLKTLGIVTADANGNGGGKTKITKALCAKMVSSVLKVKESTTPGATTGTTGTTGTNTSMTGNQTGVVKKVLIKSDTEYLILLQIGDKTPFYSMKTTVPILDESGNTLPITKLPLNSTVQVNIVLENQTLYITSLKVVGSSNTSTGTTTTPNTGTITTPSTNTGSNVVTDSTTSVNQAQTITGNLVQNITSGICRIQTADGTMKTVVLDSACYITLDGKTALAEDLKSGDRVVVTAVNNTASRITATSGTGQSVSDGEVTSKKLSAGGYVYTVKQNGYDVSVTIPHTASATRNGKSVELSKIRLGDTIKLTQKNNVVTNVEATGTRTTVQGTITQVIVSATPQVVLNTASGMTTYTIASDAEIYDMNTSKVVSLRDLHLGQDVALLLDSKEVISLDIEKNTTAVNVMGSIVGVGKRYAYLDVLVDYDYMTGESKVYKRINLPDDVKVYLNGREKRVSDLDEGMNIVVNYKYLDDTEPEKILIIK